MLTLEANDAREISGIGSANLSSIGTMTPARVSRSICGLRYSRITGKPEVSQKSSRFRRGYWVKLTQYLAE